MSEPPVRPRSRELEIVRVLFDKHLLERAVNLAEARWEGSGEMVRLAYHWQDLGPAERRQKLEDIGPEQLARFRELGDLDPELARVLDTLEQRGVIPSASGFAQGAAESQEEVLPPVYDDPPAPVEKAADVEVVYETPQDAGRTEEQTIDLPDSGGEGGSGWSPDLSSLSDRISEVDLDSVDLAGYAQAEQERRAEAVQSGEELLQRVRARLDSTARRVTSNPMGSGSSPSTLPTHVPARMPGQASGSSVLLTDEETSFLPPPDYWLNRLKDETVVVADANTVLPTEDQLVALANELGLELAEFVVDAGTSRSLFGGLKRNGGKVDVVVGPVPEALAHPTLVVIRGRLFPRMEGRMRTGMFDIPGTRASVRIHPSARVLVVSRDS